MANLIDRVLLGGAFVCSGLIHRKVSQVEHRVEHVEQVQDELAEQPAGPGPGPDAPSGMPLPTGYGIQVTGPGNEDIVIPICLPPGFELGSLVIVPSFLPDGERVPAEAVRPVAVAPLADDDPTDAPAPQGAPAERLDGGVRLVYGESQPYSAQLDQTPLPAPGEREAPALREAPPLRDSVL